MRGGYQAQSGAPEAPPATTKDVCPAASMSFIHVWVCCPSCDSIIPRQTAVRGGAACAEADSVRPPTTVAVRSAVRAMAEKKRAFDIGFLSGWRSYQLGIAARAS